MKYLHTLPIALALTFGRVAFADCTSCSTPQLPTSFVSATLNFNTLPNFYWQFNLSGVPLGLSVSHGGYQGWCADTKDFWISGATLPVKLFSSYDLSMPSADYSSYWGAVNWLINNKRRYPSASTGDIQNAIWELLGQNFGSSAIVTQMVNDAIKYGLGFHPGEGQAIAIIVDPNFDSSGHPIATDRHQVTFFELFCPLTQGYWKNHSSAWPLNATIILGSTTYNTSVPSDVTKLLAIFLSPVAGNATIELEHQLIAAELNVAAGAGTGPIASTIASAIPLATPGSNVKASSPQGQVMTNLASTLDSFNSGTLPGVCAN